MRGPMLAGAQGEGGGRAYDHRLFMRILGYLRPSARRVVLATVLLVMVSLATLAGPLITRLAIDRYIADGDLVGLGRICLLWFGLLIVTALLQYAQIVTMNLIGQRAMVRLRDEIYGHLQRLPMSFYDRNPVGRLMTRATNDVEVLNSLFTSGVVSVIGDLFALVGIMIVLVVMDVRLALVTFVSLPLVFLVSVQFRTRVRRAFRRIRAALARINSYLQESLSGMAVIKAMQGEVRNDEEFAHLNREHQNAYLESVRAFALYFPMVELIQSITIALILWYGGGRVMRDALTFGALVAFIQYTGRFFRPIRDLSNMYNILQDAMASSERIFALLDEAAEPDVALPVAGGDAPPEGRERHTRRPGIPPELDPGRDITYEDVHFSYDKRTPILEGLSIRIPAGKTTAIVGPTGSGKTTMAALLTRFYEPTRGRIRIGDVDIRTLSRRGLRRALAIVEQDVFLFSGTVEENIRLWDAEIAPETLEHALRTSHADHIIRRMPKGLMSEVTERGAGFSTGERQLLAFARALAFDPDILILDEATASVDSETEALIQDALRALLAGRTAIVIAHRLSTIASADQILVLNHGRVCERGTHEELLALDGLYACLHRLQFQEGEAECGRSRE